MVELVGWKTTVGLVFGGHEGPIEQDGTEWAVDQQTETKENKMIPKLCDNTCYIIDSKDIEKRIQDLKRELDERIIKLKRELKILEKLGQDYLKIPGEIANWMEGVTLVRDDYFHQHAMAIAADQMIQANQPVGSSQADLDSWPLKFIDWDMATEALKHRYISIIYDGVKYWVKAPT
ncbi:MAG: hypothetical protein IMF11_18345 [Proteobacteria bacterium]|nr:hypothetical protein [Pseudomonadota bacterium]